MYTSVQEDVAELVRVSCCVRPTQQTYGKGRVSDTSEFILVSTTLILPIVEYPFWNHLFFKHIRALRKKEPGQELWNPKLDVVTVWHAFHLFSSFQSSLSVKDFHLT